MCLFQTKMSPFTILIGRLMTLASERVLLDKRLCLEAHCRKNLWKSVGSNLLGNCPENVLNCAALPYPGKRHSLIPARSLIFVITLMLLLFASTKFCDFGIPTILRVLNFASRAKFCEFAQAKVKAQL